jgi:hypothetical protein
MICLRLLEGSGIACAMRLSRRFLRAVCRVLMRQRGWVEAGPVGTELTKVAYQSILSAHVGPPPGWPGGGPFSRVLTLPDGRSMRAHRVLSTASVYLSGRRAAAIPAICRARCARGRPVCRPHPGRTASG